MTYSLQLMLSWSSRRLQPRRLSRNRISLSGYRLVNRKTGLLQGCCSLNRVLRSPAIIPCFHHEKTNLFPVLAHFVSLRRDSTETCAGHNCDSCRSPSRCEDWPHPG